ncbi:Plant self-incompatibility S1, partial [Arabidopsis thaliana x Arabidopsis arenosa]
IMMMNPKTIVTNLLLLILLQISNFSTIVLSFEPIYRKDYKSEYTVDPDTVTHIIVSNELYGLKKGNVGFVCTHGPKVWRKTKPGQRYSLLRFKHSGRVRFMSTNCHIRSNRGFVNFHIFMQPDLSAHCFPSYICKYSIRKDGVYYKHENKFFPWRQFPRSTKGRSSSKVSLRNILKN